tara:strand:- start:33 stop:218 length:186 start_codon:yes stop_codon:yes gene_type:complete
MAGLKQTKQAFLEFLPLVAIALILANNPYDGDELWKSMAQAASLAISRVLVEKIRKKDQGA